MKWRAASVGSTSSLIPSLDLRQHGADLSIRIFERALCRYHEVGTTRFLRRRELGGDALPSLRLADAVSRHHASNLRRRIATREDDDVEVMFPAGLEQKRDIRDGEALIGCERREPAVD